MLDRSAGDVGEFSSGQELTVLTTNNDASKYQLNLQARKSRPTPMRKGTVRLRLAKTGEYALTVTSTSNESDFLCSLMKSVVVTCPKGQEGDITGTCRRQCDETTVMTDDGVCLKPAIKASAQSDDFEVKLFKCARIIQRSSIATASQQHYNSIATAL